MASRYYEILSYVFAAIGTFLLAPHLIPVSVLKAIASYTANFYTKLTNLSFYIKKTIKEFSDFARFISIRMATFIVILGYVLFLLDACYKRGRDEYDVSIYDRFGPSFKPIITASSIITLLIFGVFLSIVFMNELLSKGDKYLPIVRVIFMFWEKMFYILVYFIIGILYLIIYSPLVLGYFIVQIQVLIVSASSKAKPENLLGYIGLILMWLSLYMSYIKG